MLVYQNTTGGALIALAGMLAYAAFLAWAGSPAPADRRPVALAATGAGLVVAAVNVIAAALGWWGDYWVYALPLPLQAGILLLWPAVGFALVLAGYRWLARHRRRPLMAYGIVLLVVLVPLTVVGDLWALGSGMLAFGSGYQIYHDVPLGLAFFGLPVLLYEAIRRRQTNLRVPGSFTGVGVRNNRFTWSRIYAELIRRKGGIDDRIGRMTRGR